ncbi:MAG TPA: alkaline shock response membrane anchor protein AmaP [Clostridia bacterium]|nr:alkaline shock response membrane anchor protein AmaP [Clostridia bacterium]
MKLYERVLFAIYSLIIIACSLMVLLIALGWQEPLISFQALLAENQTRWLLALGAALVMLIALKLFFDGFRREPSRKALVESGELGQVQISVTAIEHMVKKAAMKIKGVREVKPKIRCIPEGVAVLLQVQVTPDLNIPQTTADIQNEVRDYLENTAGLKLLEAKVLVDHITKDLKNRVE